MRLSLSGICLVFQERVLEFFTLLHIEFGNLARHAAHLGIIGLTLGDANGATAVEGVESMGAFEHIIVGRQDETLLQAGFRFRPVEVIHLAQAVDIANLEVILAVLVLLAAADLAVGDTGSPGLVPNGGGVVEGDLDALQSVGDLDRDGVQSESSHLLEVGELGDFLPVQPDLPAEPPGGDGRLLPVVLDQADVVLAGVNADGFQGVEVQLYRVARIGLEDDLELGVLLEAVGVLAVTPVVRTHGGFNIGNIPRLGTEHTQEGVGIHRAGTHLGVVGLGDEAAFLRPEILELEDDGLQGGGHGLDTNLVRLI